MQLEAGRNSNMNQKTRKSFVVKQVCRRVGRSLDSLVFLQAPVGVGPVDVFCGNRRRLVQATGVNFQLSHFTSSTLHTKAF